MASRCDEELPNGSIETYEVDRGRAETTPGLRPIRADVFGQHAGSTMLPGYRCRRDDRQPYA